MAFGLVAALAASAVLPAIAQDPASTILQQNEERARELAASQAASGTPVVTEPVVRAELPPPGGTKFLLKSVVFEPPSEFLSAAELDAIVDRYIGKTLDFSGVSSLVRDVNDLYAEKGVVTAGAVLPPQRLADGTLEVRLVEGRQGVVSIVGEHVTDSDFLLDHVKLTRGDGVVDVPQAAKDIVWFNKTHQAQMSLLLRPGATFGLTDLTLGITEPRENALTLFMDNQGVASTGSTQWGASYQRYGLLGRDDRLMFYATASLGSIAGTLTFDTPFTKYGTRLSLSQTLSAIKVIDGPTEPLHITGTSSATTATVSQPFFVNTEWALLGIGTVSYGESASWSSDVPLVETSTLKTALGFSLSYATDGVSFAVQPQLIYVHAVAQVPSEEANDFLIATASANGSVRLPGDFTLVANGAAQYAAETDLPGSLLFQIGGPNTVRGYPSDGVGGNSGYFIRTELHHAVPQLAEGLDAYVLADFGQVFSSYPVRTTMGSVGVGVTHTWENRISLDVAAAVPVVQAVDDQADFAVYARLSGTAY